MNNTPLPSVLITDHGVAKARGVVMPSGEVVIQFVDNRPIRPVEIYKSENDLRDVYRSTSWEVAVGYAYSGRLHPTPEASGETG